MVLGDPGDDTERIMQPEIHEIEFQGSPILRDRDNIRPSGRRKVDPSKQIIVNLPEGKFILCIVDFRIRDESDNLLFKKRNAATITRKALGSTRDKISVQEDLPWEHSSDPVRLVIIDPGLDQGGARIPPNDDPAALGKTEEKIIVEDGVKVDRRSDQPNVTYQLYRIVRRSEDGGR